VTALEKLRAALEKISRPKHWTQSGFGAIEKVGRPTCAQSIAKLEAEMNDCSDDLGDNFWQAW